MELLVGNFKVDRKRRTTQVIEYGHQIRTVYGRKQTVYFSIVVFAEICVNLFLW